MKPGNRFIYTHQTKQTGNSIKAILWRDSVLDRDRYICQKCLNKASGTNLLCAHHIKSREEFPELIFDIDNGQTLCIACHVSLHMKGKTKQSAFLNHHHTDEAKIKNSLAHLGRKHSQETINKMSESHKGEKNHNYGKLLSKATKEKLRQANIGHKHTEETKLKIKQTMILLRTKQREERENGYN